MESFEREIRRLEYYHTNRPLVVGYWSWGLGPQYFCLRCGRKEFSPPLLPGGVNFFREQNWWLLNLPSIIVPISIFLSFPHTFQLFFLPRKLLRLKKKWKKKLFFPTYPKAVEVNLVLHPKTSNDLFEVQFFLIKTKPSRKKTFFPSMIGDNRGWSPMVRVDRKSVV